MSLVLYLEPVGGIAGDMFLSAAVELGVEPRELERALSGLGLPAWRLELARAERHGIVGTHLDVVVELGEPEGAHRSLSEIRSLIEAAGSMPEKARERALRAFQLLGEAEAKVHGQPLEEVHFHEVGALDSIVDLCGAAVALELLGSPEVFSAPPPLGSGLVQSEHGPIPAPGPATLELLRGLPVRFEGTGELTTPTGAALLKAFAKVEPPPEMEVQRVGYGVGTFEFADRPNVLRATLGRKSGAQSALVVEANLDDCSPQLIGAVLEKLLEEGALDVYVLPATMKKSRPGHLLGAVVKVDRRDAVVRTLLSESTTLGVRMHRVDRAVLERGHQVVETPFGSVRVKVGRLGAEVMNAQPELEDCRALAKKAGVPLKRIISEAVAAYWKR
ncbi:MAG: nickel pincer cofactor biosynthesis protein LarC [Myxococcales bacterium]|nr:nickel pincer cofactor biosynthesis protein LarC [Myxococcales bacterium]